MEYSPQKNEIIKTFHFVRPVPLINIQSSCFMNVCFQILNQCHEIVYALNNINCEIDMNSLLYMWCQFYKDMIKRDLSKHMDNQVYQMKFITKIREICKQNNCPFDGENDASEFMLYLINSFHQAIKKPFTYRVNKKKSPEWVQCQQMLHTIYNTEYSEIMNILYFITTTQIWSEDRTVLHSNKPEHMFMLYLPIPPLKQITLYDCFDYYIYPETVTNWFNEKTNAHETISKKNEFCTFPEILFITLQKQYHRGHQKQIVFPIIDLDLNSYISDKYPKKKDYTYHLMAICNHYGTIGGGHYNCIVNTHPHWVMCDDDKLGIISDVENMCSCYPYMLVYRRK